MYGIFLGTFTFCSSKVPEYISDDDIELVSEDDDDDDESDKIEKISSDSLSVQDEVEVDDVNGRGKENENQEDEENNMDILLINDINESQLSLLVEDDDVGGRVGNGGNKSEMNVFSDLDAHINHESTTSKHSNYNLSECSPYKYQNLKVVIS